MAELLERPQEAACWREQAEELRQTILRYTFDEEDGMFYDRWEDGTFNRCKCDVLSRVLQEHVPDQALFEQLFEKEILPLLFLGFGDVGLLSGLSFSECS